MDTDGNGVSRNTLLDKKTIMNSRIEAGHAEVIALALVEWQMQPDQELWGIEVVDITDRKQYFRVCNCTNARANMASLEETEFIRLMVEFVVDQIRKEENLSEDSKFALLLLKSAQEIGHLQPIALHNMYMDQIDRLNQIVETYEKQEIPEEQEKVH